MKRRGPVNLRAATAFVMAHLLQMVASLPVSRAAQTGPGVVPGHFILVYRDAIVAA